MKILVLGGTGAMGVPITNILAETGEDVYVTTRKDRVSIYDNVHYMIGNAHDISFVSKLLEDDWDAIIDFMVYATSEFKERYEQFLTHTKQYIYLSSSRVYANSKEPITEQSSRLLDVTDDEIYLQQKEYALEKARQEDLLFQSKGKNWTIIRPYITYNDRRLQLGVLEKEAWLNRALAGKSIVFSKDIAEKTTTLTYGNDVAERIVAMIGNENALGEVFHITSNYSIKWKEVLDIYLDAITEVTGNRPKVYWIGNSKYMEYVMGKTYQIKYDRLFDRRFDNSKIIKAVISDTQNFDVGQIEYMSPKEGLTTCVKAFIQNNYDFQSISWKVEGYHDKLTKEKTNLLSIPSIRSKLIYLVYRYVPIWGLKILRNIRQET